MYAESKASLTKGRPLDKTLLREKRPTEGRIFRVRRAVHPQKVLHSEEKRTAARKKRSEEGRLAAGACSPRRGVWEGRPKEKNNFEAVKRKRFR